MKTDDVDEDFYYTSRTFVMEDLILYCETDEFQTSIKNFKQKYANIFVDIAESKSPEDEVQKIEYTEIFQNYQLLIEELLEHFIKKNRKCTIISIYQECKDAIDSNFTPLFEEHKHKWFVDLLFSWSDYNYFLNDIINEVRHFKRK